MSAFNFIDNTSSNHPSPSLLDEIYESQQFHSFVNQGSWHNSTKSSPKIAKASSLSNSSSPSSPQLKRSAFSFIKQTSSSPTLEAFTPSEQQQQQEQHDLLFSVHSSSPSTIPTKPLLAKANPQFKLSSITSQWTRLESERSHEFQTLHRLYKKRAQVYDQINQLTESIRLAKQQKDTALENEDYSVAETMQANEEKMTNSLEELKSDVIEHLNLKIQSAWQQLSAVIKKETECADDMMEQCQIVKDERQRQLVKFGMDSERIHESKMQSLQQEREKVENDKSEVAFDFGLWEQSDMDLKERMDEAIHAESEEKNKLTLQVNTLEMEIQELLNRVEQLKSEKQNSLQELDQINATIKLKLDPFREEEQEHKKEYHIIQQKKEEIDQRTLQLDEEELELHKQMELDQDEKARGWEELDSYDKKIEMVAKRKDEGWIELEKIKQVSNIIQKRDQKVAQQQSELIKSRVALLRQGEKTNKLQKEMIEAKQKEIERLEWINQMENKLSSIQRYKSLAVESGQFQQANKLNEQIKAIQSDLTHAKMAEAGNPKNPEQQQAWEEAKSRLEKVKLDYVDLENQSETERKAILAKAKEEIKSIVDSLNATTIATTIATTAANTTAFAQLKSVLEIELNLLDQ